MGEWAMPGSREPVVGGAALRARPLVEEVALHDALHDAEHGLGVAGSVHHAEGAIEERVKVSSERLTIQRDIVAKQIQGFENVDPYEANVRVTDLTTQLDTAYALTVRIQQLNILKFMS